MKRLTALGVITASALGASWQAQAQISGTQSNDVAGCTYVAYNLFNVDCSYANTGYYANGPLATPPAGIGWAGPAASDGVYAPTSSVAIYAEANIGTTSVVSQGGTIADPSPGDGKYYPTITGNLTVTGTGAGATIAGNFVVGAEAILGSSGPTNSAIYGWSSLTETLASTKVSSATAGNIYGGYTYVIGNGGFPSLLNISPHNGNSSSVYPDGNPTNSSFASEFAGVLGQYRYDTNTMGAGQGGTNNSSGGPAYDAPGSAPIEASWVFGPGGQAAATTNIAAKGVCGTKACTAAQLASLAATWATETANVGASTTGTATGYFCLTQTGASPGYQCSTSATNGDAAIPTPGAPTGHANLGWTNVVLQVLTNAAGNVVSAQGYWTQEYNINLASCTTVQACYYVQNANNSFNAGYFTATSVPIPAAAWLFGSALGLLGFRRRRS